MATWLLAIDRDYCTYEELKYRKVIAQGWSAIGDLSPLLPIKDREKFKDIITSYIDYFYDGWVDKRDPGRILFNLLSMSQGDYIVCCEGETVKGIAKLTKNVKYDYHNLSLHEYAQTIYPVTDWKDVKGENHGIKLKAMGPIGIQKYGNNTEVPKLFKCL